jgi:O-antigen ligase
VLVIGFPGALNLEFNERSIDRATSGRFDLMDGGVALARERPLAGWGSGSFEDEYREHEDSSSREATAASHTIPITVAAEQGVIGLAMYVALLVLAFRRLLRGARGVAVRAALAAGFAALVLHTWLYASFLEDPVTWTLLALGSSLAITPVSRREDDPDGATSMNGHRREPIVVARSAP